MKGDIELFHGDARDFVRFAPKIDTALFDPPYSPAVHSKATSAGTGGFSPTGKGVRARDFGFACLSPELACALAECVANVKRWGLVYSDVESIHLWRGECTALGAEYIRVIPWVRWSQPQLSGDRPPTGWEALSVFHYAKRTRKGKIKPVRKHWNGYGELTHLSHGQEVSVHCPACAKIECDLHGELIGECPGAVVECPSGIDFALGHLTMRGAGKHKAQKPLAQALDLVSWFSDPGEIVADLVMGRGTTMRACQILGREGLGVELDRAEFKRARARLRGGLDASESVQVARFVERVQSETRVSDKFPPAQARQDARIADAERAAAWLR